MATRRQRNWLVVVAAVAANVRLVIIYTDAAQHRRVARILVRRAVTAARIAPHQRRRIHRHIRTRPARYRVIVLMLSLVAQEELAVVLASPHHRRAVHAVCRAV